MKFWQWIELDNEIQHGKTADGLSYWKKDIHGWNDNKTLLDATSLVSVTTVETDGTEDIEFNINYSRPELHGDLMIGKLVDQAKKDLAEAVRLSCL
ncbi:hypothetical protein [Planococcus chinensis]|uniref:Uncharacterized protein n=1 Tax=Planococcus chinensis TaxID=272917 RepID=A0ABW4QGQ1_9BACL